MTHSLYFLSHPFFSSFPSHLACFFFKLFDILWIAKIERCLPLVSHYSCFPVYFLLVHFSRSLYRSFMPSSPKPSQFPSCLCPLSLDFRDFPLWICPFLSYLSRNLLLFPLSPPGPFPLLVPLFLSAPRSSLVHAFCVFNQSVSRPALQGEAELLIEKSRWKGGEVTEGGGRQIQSQLQTWGLRGGECVSRFATNMWVCVLYVVAEWTIIPFYTYYRPREWNGTL